MTACCINGYVQLPCKFRYFVFATSADYVSNKLFQAYRHFYTSLKLCSERVARRSLKVIHDFRDSSNNNYWWHNESFMNRKRSSCPRPREVYITLISHDPDEIWNGLNLDFFRRFFLEIVRTYNDESYNRTDHGSAPCIVYSKVPLQTQQSVDCHCWPS